MPAFLTNITQSFHRCQVIRYVLILTCALSPLLISAQFRSHSEQELFKQYSNGTGTRGNIYWIVAYKAVDCESVSHFKIVRQLGNGLAIIYVNDTSKLTVAGACIAAIAPANDTWKLSPALQLKTFAKQQSKEVFFTVVATQLHLLFTSLKNKRFSFEVVSSFKDAQAATIRCNVASFMKVCLPDTNLLFVDIFVQPKPDVLVPGYRRSISNLQFTAYHFPNATGSGITAGIKENKPLENDIDLQKRILASPIAAAVSDNHATTIATLIGGAGNSDYSGKGVASRCRFFPSSFSRLFADSSLLLMQNNVSVQNHSYGTVIQSFYGAEAVSYDIQAAQMPTLLHVFSSGNHGTAAATTGTYTGITGFANITGNFKAAKNVLTIAAVDTGGRLAVFNSSGPLYDGRLAPQMTALGPNGTSEAAAIVSGAVAVLQQVYRDSNASILPVASLTKALLYTTCDDIGNAGIDYQSGFGLLNVYKAIRCLQQRRYDSGSLAQRQVWTKNISLPPGTANLKMTLCWTDTAALVNNSTALVNDLDLTFVETATGTLYRPWVLNAFPAADSLRKRAVRSRDSLNTAEQISIDLPTGGNYQMQVTGRKISTVQSQTFHVAYTWDTLNAFQFTNPSPPLENDQLRSHLLDARWAVALADTNAKGNLFVSYNGGLSWVNIGSGIALKNKVYNWQLPDTAALAQLRMDCAFGSFFSSQFILSPVANLHVDYLCRDSMRLSWPANRLGSTYTLFTLGDTAYIKPLLTTADTFVVLNRSIFPNSIYAVQPVIVNLLQATRSVAVDVRNQGSNCFYNTFYAQPVADSIMLTLEVGYTAGLDSIQFEKVNASGSIIRTLATLASNAASSYSVWDAFPSMGSNYYRAKIWRGRQFVTTEIISAVHTGKALAFFYPNPVQQGQPLHILLKESTGTGKLQLLDMTGRLIKIFSIGGNDVVSTNDLPAGFYAYRILQADDAILATGKIIVQ